MYLLPPAVSDWLPENHLAFFLMDVVMELDLRKIERSMRKKDPRGTRPYHPRMMTALLVYGYCIGVFSSRKIERATWEDVAFRTIAKEQHPDHTVISEFRRRHLNALKDLFLQTVRLCQAAGLVKLGRVALDGTKLKASASKHKAMSYDRMLKSEAELKAEIEQLIAQAAQTDQEEDEKYGKGKHGDELPEELRRREERRARIQQAREALEAEAREAHRRELEEQAKQKKKKEKKKDPGDRGGRGSGGAGTGSDARDEAVWPRHKVPHTADGDPTGKAQRNFTDPDSRIMKRDGTYLQGYNGQAAVDESHQIIVACGLTNQPPDVEHLPPMLEEIRAVTGQYPDELLADTGYFSAEHITYCEDRGVDPYIATGKLKHGDKPPTVRGRPPANQTAKQSMQRKLLTKKGRAIYAKRKQIVEPVFGQIRIGQGFRELLMRGLQKAEGEWALLCAAHNIRKLYRASLQPE